MCLKEEQFEFEKDLRKKGWIKILLDEKVKKKYIQRKFEVCEKCIRALNHNILTLWINNNR